MTLEVLDEAIALPGRGAALLSLNGEAAALLGEGATLLDARGNRHAVGRVTEQDGVWTIWIPKAEAGYFERLFRDVTVDATRFHVEE